MYDLVTLQQKLKKKKKADPLFPSSGDYERIC